MKAGLGREKLVRLSHVAFAVACLGVAGCSNQSVRAGLLPDLDGNFVPTAIAKQIGANPAEMRQAFDSSPEVEVFSATGTTNRMAKKFGVSTDLAMTRHLQAMVRRLTNVLEGDDRQYEVVLLSNHKLNAFTPGAGKILVNEGLLVYCKTEGEVAAVLAHEIAHVIMRHPQRIRQLALVSKASRRFIDTITPIDLQHSMAPLLKRKSLDTINYFRRNQEIVADGLGMDIMVAAGYDPRGMISALRSLSQLEASLQNGQKSVVGNHPPSLQRELAAAAKLRKFYSATQGIVTSATFEKLAKPYHLKRDRREARITTQH